MEKKKSEFDRLISIMKKLRAPDGCPWDRKQTWKSLCPHIVEEAYELIAAIQNGSESQDGQHVLEECGDLLLQVIFVGTIAEEQGKFAIDDIPRAIGDKLVRRHPHIFGETPCAVDADQAYRGWEEIKRRERASHHEDTSVLAGVPRSLPAAIKAYRIQQKVASVGFDWQKDTQQPVMDKIGEELEEVREALEDPALQNELAGEIGDLLFAVINLARRCRIDPESALALTNEKFSRRFRFVEDQVEKSGKDWKGHSLDELELFWKQAKSAGL